MLDLQVHDKKQFNRVDSIFTVMNCSYFTWELVKGDATEIIKSWQPYLVYCVFTAPKSSLILVITISIPSYNLSLHQLSPSHNCHGISSDIKMHPLTSLSHCIIPPIITNSNLPLLSPLISTNNCSHLYYPWCLLFPICYKTVQWYYSPSCLRISNAILK